MRERSVPAQRSEEPPAAPGHREARTNTLPYLGSGVLSHAVCRGACGSLRARLPLLLLVVEFLPDPRLAEQAPDRLRRLRPPVEPLERHLLVDQEPRGILLGIVDPDPLDVSPVPGRPGIGHHDAVRRQLLPARARQTNLYRHHLTSRIDLFDLRYHGPASNNGGLF